MAGRWSDERERSWEERGREGDWRDRLHWSGSEDRSFDRGDRVFGERESGAGYNRPLRDYGRREPGAGGPHAHDADRPDWQDRDYQGVSPAFRGHEHDYETGYRANPRFGDEERTRYDTGRGRPGYGDAGRSRAYGAEYGYGADPAHQQGRRFGSRDADERYERALRGPSQSFAGGTRYGTYSGGTGGYDYERGYGDGGREQGPDDGRGFEDRAREAGDFFRRTGRRISSWFSDVAGETTDRDEGERESRGARGLGPKGYKRSDERISDEVHQRLTDDSWLDASDIGVSVSGGEVTLSGTVENREAKHRAERIVEDLSGVTHVQNNLRIKAGSFFTSAGRGFGDSANEAAVRSEGESSMETSANATGTTTRPKTT